MGIVFKLKRYSLPNIFAVTLLVGSIMVQPAFATLGSQQWVREYTPNADSSVNGGPINIVRDSASNLYVADGFHNTVTNRYSVSIIKYDTDGNKLWDINFGNYFNTASVMGMVFEYGNLYATIDAGINGSGNVNYITTKIDTGGNQLWAAQYNNVQSQTVFGSGSSNPIQVDTTGDVYLSGRDNSGLLIIKYDTSGTLLWNTHYSGGYGIDYSTDLALDSTGNLYVAASSANAPENQDYTVIKYDGGGNRLWVQSYDTGANDIPFDLTVDTAQNIYVTGYTEILSTQGYPQKFLTIKFDTNGNRQWTAMYGQVNAPCAAYSVSADQAGNVYVAGAETVPGHQISTLVKYASDGNQLWVNRTDDGEQAVGVTLILSDSGDVYVGSNGFKNYHSYNLVTKYNPNGGQIWAARYDNGTGASLQDIVLQDLDIYSAGLSCNGSSCSLITVKFAEIDDTPPVVVGLPDSQPNLNGWYNHDITINWSATDPESSATTPPPTIASTEGSRRYVSDPSCNPDNYCAVGSRRIGIDKSVPTIGTPTWSVNPLLQGQDTTVTIPAADNVSGIFKVEYTIDGGASQPMTLDIPSGTWSATFGSNLPANTYNVDFVATDYAGNTGTPATDVLAIYNTSSAYVTGHAKILPTAFDTLPIARDTSNNPAKLILGFTNVMSPASGSFDMSYVVKNNKDEFELSSTGIDWAVLQDSTHASILGHADMTTLVNGTQTVTQNMGVRIDITLGSNGAPDHVMIKLFNPGVNPILGTPAYIISDDVLANGSNLIIHQ